MATIDRTNAIRTIVLNDKKLKDAQWREEELYCIGASCVEEWEAWLSLPQFTRDEIKLSAHHESEILDPEHNRFDEILIASLEGGYAGATNEYLRDQLITLGVNCDAVVGEPVELIACPCCGARTLGERGTYDICKVCWWEDDGQDNNNAKATLGGPNKVSLTQGRINFIKQGISEPYRTDLFEFKEPIEKYSRGRFFKIDEATRTIIELGTDWKDVI